MSAKTNEHVIMRNGGAFCTHCGEKYITEMPIAIKLFTTQLRAFSKTHQDCPKTWAEPVCDPSLSIDERILFWQKNGNTGISSRTIVSKLSPRLLLPSYRWNHPFDPADFNRCHKLLEIIPEWKSRIFLMSDVSPEWKLLVENWDTLTKMLLENSGDMYEFMKKLGV